MCVERGFFSWRWSPKKHSEDKKSLSLLHSVSSPGSQEVPGRNDPLSPEQYPVVEKEKKGFGEGFLETLG